MNKLREKIVEDFINALSEDVIPWERDWYMTVTPVNSNGNVYHGLNRYMLSFVQDEMKYKDNRWMTFKQANDKGYHVKKEKRNKDRVLVVIRQGKKMQDNRRAGCAAFI